MEDDLEGRESTGRVQKEDRSTLIGVRLKVSNLSPQEDKPFFSNCKKNCVRGEESSSKEEQAEQKRIHGEVKHFLKHLDVCRLCFKQFPPSISIE